MLIVKEVEKSFGEKMVIDDLSFYIRPGECAGLIGLNGAGKTTVIRMLTGSLLPDKGTIRVNGMEPCFRQKELIGKMAMVSCAFSQLWEDMPLRFSLENCRKMYHISKQEYDRKMEELDKCMQIRSFWERKVNLLSLGQKMLGEIAYALTGNPSVLFLDEPTIGIAVDVREKVLEYLRDLCRRKGITILYTSHNMRDVEYLCDHLILLDRGKKIFDGKLERLQMEYGIGDCMELVLEPGKFPDLEDLPIEKMEYEENHLVIYYQKSVISNTLILNHITKQCNILAIKTKEPSLEDIIRFITGK